MNCNQGTAIARAKRSCQVLLSIVSTCLILCCPAFASHAETFTGQVVSISDGDTIKVLREGESQPTVVRLASIDCPEKKQEFGREAKSYTSSLTLNKSVTVSRTGFDRNHRSIGDVVLSDGRHLGSELVRTGNAWWFEKYAPNDKELESLQQAAKEAKLGLWNNSNPEAPWTYRMRLHNSRAKTKIDGRH
ncbi:thermonuclease family protein [bacterium]|nr:thermonuclease family protein [bacterium]